MAHIHYILDILLYVCKTLTREKWNIVGILNAGGRRGTESKMNRNKDIGTK